MKSSILLALVMLVACTKEKQDNNPYEGEWEISGTSAIDTGLVMYIDPSGLFRYYAKYSHFGGIVDGSVDKNGNVDGSLKSGAFSVGSMSGSLKADSGYGEYYTMGQSVEWTARRIKSKIID